MKKEEGRTGEETGGEGRCWNEVLQTARKQVNRTGVPAAMVRPGWRGPRCVSGNYDEDADEGVKKVTATTRTAVARSGAARP